MKHIDGFDYLRAICIILIVAWHAGSIAFLGKLYPGLLPLTTILNFNIALTAVPIFFALSIFLFYKKQLKDRKYFLQKRLPSLIKIYAIWMLVGAIVNFFTKGSQYLVGLTRSGMPFITLTRGTRGELFFLFCLIFVTFIAFLNSSLLINKIKQYKANQIVQTSLLILSLIMLVGMNITTMRTGNRDFSAFWNPFSFLPYVFVSYMLFSISQKQGDNLEPLPNFSDLLKDRRIKILLFLLIVDVILSWLEWQFFSDKDSFGIALPAYSRPSLVVASFMACYWAISFPVKAPRLIQEVSRESLGIYVMHFYFIYLLGYLTKQVEVLAFFFNPLINMVFAIAISMALSKLLKRSRIGRFMLNT